MLMRRVGIPIVYVIFDVLSLGGRSLMGQPYQERRRQLDAELKQRSTGARPNPLTTVSRSSRRSANAAG